MPTAQTALHARARGVRALCCRPASGAAALGGRGASRVVNSAIPCDRFCFHGRAHTARASAHVPVHACQCTRAISWVYVQHTFRVHSANSAHSAHVPVHARYIVGVRAAHILSFKTQNSLPLTAGTTTVDIAGGAAARGGALLHGHREGAARICRHGLLHWRHWCAFSCASLRLLASKQVARKLLNVSCVE